MGYRTQFYDADLFCDAQIQKFGSTRKRIGLKYSRFLNELSVRDVFVLKFHTSVVTLKIHWEKATISSAICWKFRKEADEKEQNTLNQFTYFPALELA